MPFAGNSFWNKFIFKNFLMDREYYAPRDSYLTPEQIRHEEESSDKIVKKYRMSFTGMLGTFICIGGATLLALKRRGPVGDTTKCFVPLLAGQLTTFVTHAYIGIVSVFFQMIIIKFILNFRT